MANGNGTNGPQGPHGRNLFGPPPAADQAAGAAPINPDPNQQPPVQPAPAVGGLRKFWDEHQIKIIGAVLVVILLLLLVFIGGLMLGGNKSDKKVEQATANLDKSRSEFVRAVSDATTKNEGEGTVILNTLKSEGGGMKEFLIEMIVELCNDHQLCIGNTPAPAAVTPKVTIVASDKLIKKIVDEAMVGRNEALNAKDQVIANQEGDLKRLRVDNAKLELQLSQQPAPVLYAPADTTSAEALARIERNQQELSENQAALAQEQRAIVSRIELSSTKLQEIVSEKLNSEEGAKSKAEAANCPAGTSLAIAIGAEPFDFFQIINPDELTKIVDAAGAERQKLLSDVSSEDNLTLSNGVIIHSWQKDGKPQCVNYNRFYVALGKKNGERQIVDGVLTSKIIVTFPFLKDVPIPDVFEPGKNDIVQPIDSLYLLMGGG